MNILITRRLDQSMELAEAFKKAGHDLFCVPTFEIAPINFKSEIIELLNETYDALIFFSPHAVLHFPPSSIKQYAQTPTFAVGKSTAAALTKVGFKNVSYPSTGSSSEHLLALIAFQNVQHKKFLLVQGRSGRVVIKDYLIKNNAIVNVFFNYERKKTIINKDYINLLSYEKKLNAWILTSETSLRDLESQCSTFFRIHLIQTPVIVLSERLKKAVKTVGCETVFVASSLESQALLNLISKQNWGEFLQ